MLFLDSVKAFDLDQKHVSLVEAAQPQMSMSTTSGLQVFVLPPLVTPSNLNTKAVFCSNGTFLVLAIDLMREKYASWLQLDGNDNVIVTAALVRRGLLVFPQSSAPRVHSRKHRDVSRDHKQRVLGVPDTPGSSAHEQAYLFEVDHVRDNGFMLVGSMPRLSQKSIETVFPRSPRVLADWDAAQLVAWQKRMSCQISVK